MRKKLVMLMVVALIFALTACAQEASTDTSKELGGYLYPTYADYNSPAEENGLAGTKICIEGVCKYTRNMDDAHFAIIDDNEDNSWLVMLYTNSTNTTETFDFLEGQDVCIFGKYLGFSDVVKLPCMLYETILCDGISYNFNTYVYEQIIIEDQDKEGS